MMVGSACTLYCDAMLGYVSVLILTILMRSLPTAAATWGSTVLDSTWQGPHHVAVEVHQHGGGAARDHVVERRERLLGRRGHSEVPAPPNPIPIPNPRRVVARHPHSMESFFSIDVGDYLAWAAPGCACDAALEHAAAADIEATHAADMVRGETEAHETGAADD
eukprot:CAMPEP_0197593126 /NCGR_PEP_ID=MMETSP1326-20131121/17256_1 /TAXON_ID=1155430 /ORGANISM="Genus nov. species nov., Strain RCC2288" /LENGTH=163 /DNA_ID=CAMNT_0043159009 /DNA_START=325 /DNA_END=813 /DNA_ORIENTATION=-